LFIHPLYIAYVVYIRFCAVVNILLHILLFGLYLHINRRAYVCVVLTVDGIDPINVCAAWSCIHLTENMTLTYTALQKLINQVRVCGVIGALIDHTSRGLTKYLIKAVLLLTKRIAM